MGLIPNPKRKGKNRCFLETDEGRIQIIRQVQRFGFKLTEIKDTLRKGMSCDDFPAKTAIALLTEKIAEITSDIVRLERRRQDLPAFLNVLEENRRDEYSAPS